MSDLETLRLAIQLIGKAMADGAYDHIVMPNAPTKAIESLTRMIETLKNQAVNKPVSEN